MAKNKCIPLFLMSVLVLAGMTWGCNRKDVSDSQGPLLGAYPSDAPENLSDRRLSDIFSKVSEICLETGDSCLIGDYNSKFVKRNGVIYVKSLNEIFLFDDKGKFLRKVSKVGNGPGEYDGIRDFDIVPGERGDEVWVCASNGIFRYNSATADFIAKINYKGYPNQLKYVNDTTIIVVSPGKKWINVCRTDGKVRKQFLDKDLSIASHKIAQFNKVGHRVFYQLEDSNMAAVYNELTDSLCMEQIFSGTIGLPTVEDYRSYHENYGDFKFYEPIAKDFNRLSVVRTCGNTYYALISNSDGKMELVVSNGEDTAKFLYNPKEITTFNDLAPDVDVRYLITPMATDSDDGILFILEKEEDVESNPCILDIQGIL